MAEESHEPQPPEASQPSDATNQPSTGMVQQRHGGAIHRGGNHRPQSPTPGDVRVLARKRFYQVIPSLFRIARNGSTRVGKGTQRKLKRTFRVSDQIAAANTLARYGMTETIAADDVRVAVRGTIADIRESLPRDQADALVQKIAPRWFGL